LSYIVSIDVDITEQVVRFLGQAGNTTSMFYSQDSQLLIP